MILDQSGLYQLEQIRLELTESFSINALRFRCLVSDRCRIATDGHDIFVSCYRILPLVKKVA